MSFEGRTERGGGEVRKRARWADLSWFVRFLSFFRSRLLLGPSLGRSRFVYISFLSHLHHHLPSSSSSLPKNNSTDSNIKLQRPLRSLLLLLLLSSATESSPAAHVNSEGIKRSVEKLVSSHSPVRVSGAFSKEVGEGKRKEAQKVSSLRRPASEERQTTN